MPKTKDRNMLKHFVFIGSSTFFNMLLGLLTTPIITRLVDPIDYGKWSVFTMYSGIALMVLCLGLDQSLIRYYYEQDNLKYKRALLFKCVRLPVLISFAASGVMISLVWSGLLHFEFDVLITSLLCAYTIIQLLYRFSLLLVRLAYKSKLYSLLNILNKLIYVIVALPLVLLIKQEYLLLLVIATIVAGFCCMVTSILAQRDHWSFMRCDPNACTISDKELCKYGYPFILANGITTVFQAIGKFALNHYCSYTEVGIYASTMTLVHIFAIIQTTFNTLWFPMATEHYTKNKEDRTFYQKGNQVITVLMMFLGISLIFCKDVFALLMGEKYRQAAYIMPFLIFQPIMYTISETTGMGISLMKKSKMQIVVALTACITSIILNVLLVPRLGCEGAAIATGVSYIVFFVARTLISNHYYYVDFKLPRFFILTAFVSAYALYNTFVPFNTLTVIGYIVCLAALMGLYYQTVGWIFGYAKNLGMKILKKFSHR